MLIILGLILGAAWYFHDSIPEFNLGGAVVRIAQPPEWSLMITIGGGTVLFLIGTLGTLFTRKDRTHEQT